MFHLIRIIALILFIGASAQAAELTLIYQHQSIPPVKLDDGARLDQFYARSNMSFDIDWNAALITCPAVQQHFELQSQALKSKLDRLENHWLLQNESGLAQSVRQLKHELFQFPVAGRIKAELDPDMIRLRAELNRPLIGSYSLYTAPHHASLYLLGLMNSKTVVALQSGWSIEQYVDTGRLSGADNSVGYLIEANGQWQKVPLALWNKKHIEPGPGATLFIGFEPSLLPDDMSDLNELIADYIANRIPQ